MLRKLLKVFGNDVIEFYCHPSFYGVIPEPKPAIKSIPDWFRSLPVTGNKKDGVFNVPVMTAKKCLPLLDAMSLGYTIPLCGDLQITVDDDLSRLHVHQPSNELKLLEFHDLTQVGDENFPRYPLNPLKFINHWVIKTAPGWSTLFIPPINHIDSPFTCLGGLVDTDTYPKEINFPAVWNKSGFNDIIEAGTPLVTAIPIKRGSFNKKPKIRKMSPKEFNKIETIRKQQATRQHVYTRELRVKK